MRRLGVVPKAVIGLTPIALLLVGWQLLGSDASPYYPRPGTWVTALGRYWESDQLVPALQDTVLTVAAGVVIAYCLGVPLGILIGSSRAARRALQPTLEFLRLIPPPACIPAALLLLGITHKTNIAVVAFAACWPIVLNTHAGAANVSPILGDVARSMRLRRHQRLTKLLLPAVIPSTMVGVRVAAPVAIVVALLVEMLTGSGGLGALLMSAQRSFLAPEAFCLLCVVGILGLAINYVTHTLERNILRKRGQHERN